MMEFKGKILVISKSGQFPQSHLSDSFPSLLGERFIYPSRCSDLLKQFRKKWAEICMNGADWRQLISAYRPFSQEIWKQLSIASKKQFLRHLSHIWNRYRHRMSPESALLIQDFSTRQRLKLMSGSIKNIVKEENGKLRAFFLNTKVGSIESISADHIVNCSGPEYNLLKRSEGLISSLIENGLVLADSLGMGLKLEDKEFLAGNNEGKIFALGALLFGERFEITSVPEIRDQAAAIADIIISSQAEG